MSEGRAPSVEVANVSVGTRRSDPSWRVSRQGNSSIRWALGQGKWERFLYSGCLAKPNQGPFPTRPSPSFQRQNPSLLAPRTQLPEVLRSCCFHFPSDGDLWSSCWVPGVGIAGIAEARPAPQGTPSRRLCCTAPGHICQSQRLNTSPNTRLLSGSTPKG